MQRLIAAWRAGAALEPGGRVPALDGLRAFFVFSVLAFHFWQQSWLMPAIRLPGRTLYTEPWLRTGYLWVDGMLLLSGFLLYLPFARAREAGRAMPGFAGFYTRRFWRVVPTYLLHLLVVFLVVALPEKRYATWWQALRDWLAHLSFTHPWFVFSSLQTPLNGALWTLGVEVQFYLLFPFLARAFRRMPLITCLGAYALAFLYRGWAMGVDNAAMLINQLPAFLDVYLNGFLAAMVFARLEKRGKDDGLQRIFMTAVLCAGAFGLLTLVRHQAAIREIADIRRNQLAIRYAQSVLTCLVMLGASLGLGGIRLVLGGRVAGFLAAISYQTYLWHQVIALQLRTWRLPPSAHQTPQVAGDRPWQIGFTLLALGLTLAVATALTYLVERPLARGGGRART